MPPNFPALTSVRGLAAWWVVLYHFRVELTQVQWHTLQVFASYGYLAVDLFFVMSGFVIALNYEGSMRELTWPKVARFLGFRLARIYPLHLVILIAFLANPVAILLFSSNGVPGDRYDPAYYFLSLALIQNWGLSPLLAWNIPAWSISTEWAGYLLFPCLAWASSRFISRSIHAVAVVACMLVLLAMFGRLNGDLGNNIPQAALIRCLLEFTMGIAFYRFWLLQKQSYPDGNAMLGVALAVLIGGAAMHWPDYIFAPIGLLLLIVSLVDGRSVGARLLNNKALIYVGEISYSTYLVHYLVKDWIKFVLLRDGVSSETVLAAYIGVTAVASVCLYHWIELPGRRVGRERVNAWLSPPKVSGTYR